MTSSDGGIATERAEEGGGTAAVRRRSKMTVSLDLDNDEADFVSVDEPDQEQQYHAVMSKGIDDLGDISLINGRYIAHTL
eukprot:CAMPEP_0113576238 /NCGR_PEP_ID=MMETSP0015_2-20120614/28180_1 /TAXON_ID=2838 /ORGANISM="Odontella" /LENGTH=79 /DNA_ID=CAMNT_0000479641 /DNA_START=301 /DNA_END=541 /DNA_ORIENTATION=- /assembly_acc=CAM_ASM_000160